MRRTIASCAQLFESGAESVIIRLPETALVIWSDVYPGIVDDGSPVAPMHALIKFGTKQSRV